MNQIDEENPNLPKENESQLLSSISQVNIRLGFIRKVYGILLFQLTITVAFAILMMYSTSMVSWVLNNSWILWVDLLLVIVIMLVLACFQKIARQVPYNYILLTIFTVGFGLLVGFISAMSDPAVVLIAAVMTLCVTVSLTIYACTTKTDFTLMGGFLFIFGMILMVLGVFLWWGVSSTMKTLLCGLGVIFYGLYLIYDTQLIVGKHRYKLNIDDYVFAAMMIYVDIIGLFLELLNLLR